MPIMYTSVDMPPTPGSMSPTLVRTHCCAVPCTTTGDGISVRLPEDDGVAAEYANVTRLVRTFWRYTRLRAHTLKITRSCRKFMALVQGRNSGL